MPEPKDTSTLQLQAIVAVVFLLLFLGTILISIGVAILFGFAWMVLVLGVLFVAFGLILGFSV